jgi:hypothetical protein
MFFMDGSFGLDRINTTSLALMMPSGAVHTIIPGRAPSREPGIQAA